MIARRSLPLLALLPFGAAASAAAPRDIAFRVLRAGSEVGTHTVRFTEAGGLLRARSEVRIAVRLMGFTVFRYSHDTEEAWRDDRLVALESRLDRNGQPGTSTARAEGDALRLTGTAGEARLPAAAAPLTWWRAESLRPGVPLFDPREGKPVAPRLESSSVAGGTRVRVIGGEGAEVFYDAAGRWVGFATTGEDGSAVTYERT